MKKTCQAAAKPTAEFSFDFAGPFDLAGRLLELRTYCVIALAIPCLVGLHWMMIGHAKSRQGTIPQIVSELQSIKQQAEATASWGYQRRRKFNQHYPTLETEFVRSSVTPSDYEEARRRYESLRKQMTVLIDRLKSTEPRGFTFDHVAEVKRNHRPLTSSFTHFSQWVHGPPQPGRFNISTELPRLVEYAQAHNNRLGKEQLQQLEACKLVPWQLAVREMF